MSKRQEQQKLAKWRWYRNKAISLLCEDSGLRPSQVVRLRYCELYQDGKPVGLLRLRPEIGHISGKKDNLVRLSKKLQRNLAQMYSEPLLFESRGFSIPVITDRPIARALTHQHVSRIVRQSHNDRVCQTQFGAAMENMIEDGDPIINEALNA